MEGISKEDIEKLRRSWDKLENSMERRMGNQVGNSNIHINAGGIGVLVTTAFASFMLGLCICMGFWMLHQQKQIDDLHDYLNVVYQYAPQLKPKDFK